MNEKNCSRCGEIKLISQYDKNSRSVDGFGYYCKTCRSDISKEKYQRNKETAKAYVEKNREKVRAYNKEYLRQYRNSGVKQDRKLEMCLLKGGMCEECGFKATSKTIAAFDFHHINPEEKDYTPSDMVLMKWEKVEKELAKCQLLCSNCHRIFHHRQYRGKP